MDPPPVIAVDDRQVDAAAAAVARILAGAGCAAGDRVALLAGNSPGHLAARAAAAALDLVLVPINPRLAVPEIAWILGNARPAVLLVEPARTGDATAALAAAGEPAPRLLILAGEDDGGGGPAIDPGAIGATLLYTSGTTGRPKGCLRPAAVEAARAAELTTTYGLDTGDVQLIACPLAHSAPGAFARAGRAAGAATVLMPRFTAEGWLDAVATRRITFCFVVPTQCERLLAVPAEQRRGFDLGSLRALVVAGAPFPAATRRRMVDWLGDGVLWEFYGSSETGTIAVLRPSEQLGHADSVGRPLPTVSLRLLDGERRPVAAGGDGELYVRSATVMAGYLDEGGAPGPVDAVDGHISVGDLGRIDGDGYLHLVDRVHDTIISGGVNVYPAEVERALAEHPRVIGAVAFGVTDPEWGQIVAAAVALDRPGDPAAEIAGLRAFLRQRIAAYKVPRGFALVGADELPLGSSGKPLRRRAAAELTGRLLR